MRVLWTTIISLVLLSACADRQIRRGDHFLATGESLKALGEYREALVRHPRDADLKSKLLKLQQQAANTYYARAEAFRKNGDYDQAMAAYKSALEAMPEYEQAEVSLAKAAVEKEVAMVLKESDVLVEAGKVEQAIAGLQRAARLIPEHPAIQERLQSLGKAQQPTSPLEPDVISSKPVTLNLKQVDLRSAFEFIAKAYDINILFDEGVKNTPLTLYAKDVTFRQAIDMLLSNSRTFYKKVGPNTLLVIPDTKEKRDQYQELLIRTFPLNQIRAKDMADTVKSVINVRKLSINESLNTLVIRDTPEVLGVVEKLINANDKKPAEALFDVEILEINRSRALRVGADFGSELKASFPNIPIAKSFEKALKGGTVTVPAQAFRYFKQDVDAKSLATPQIRALDGKSAKILIGDRVPLRASTVVDATGQTRTTYEYKDIGIKLNVEPEIHLDESSTIKLGLEVSSLGENLGTVNEPAYRIGTRSAESVMLLRDGETAVIGGLVRDEERNTRVKVPGLGSIPLLGTLFTSADDSGGVTDIVLTITPRIVRGWDMSNHLNAPIYSGTELNIVNHPLFQGSADIALDEGGKPLVAAVSTSEQPEERPSSQDAVPGEVVADHAGFGATEFEAAVGDSVKSPLILQARHDIESSHFEILFNPSLVEFEGADDVALPDTRINQPQKGMVQVDTKRIPAGKVVLVGLKWKPLAAGTSYLTFRNVSWGLPQSAKIAPVLQSAQLVVHDAETEGNNAR